MVSNIFVSRKSRNINICLFSIWILSVQDGSGPLLPAAYEPEPLGKYGTLDVAFEYDSSEQYLAVTVTAATDIPALKQTGNIAWQVHLVLLPTKKQRAKTGVQRGPCPVFTETFKFSRVEQEALGDYAVRFRLYSIRRMKKEKVLGEKVFNLTKLNLQGKMALPVTLEPGSELTVRARASVPAVTEVYCREDVKYWGHSLFQIVTKFLVCVCLKYPALNNYKKCPG